METNAGITRYPKEKVGSLIAKINTPKSIYIYNFFVFVFVFPFLCCAVPEPVSVRERKKKRHVGWREGRREGRGERKGEDVIGGWSSDGKD
jgi:hypothetical protein